LSPRTRAREERDEASDVVALVGNVEVGHEVGNLALGDDVLRGPLGVVGSATGLE
jgi:hypothetical protein